MKAKYEISSIVGVSASSHSLLLMLCLWHWTKLVVIVKYVLCIYKVYLTFFLSNSLTHNHGGSSVVYY